jgi:hypothetical protein
MAETRRLTTRVPEALEAAARAGSPELAALDLSTLVRVGLAVLAGHPVPVALDLARAKSGPKPREERAA